MYIRISNGDQAEIRRKSSFLAINAQSIATIRVGVERASVHQCTVHSKYCVLPDTVVVVSTSNGLGIKVLHTSSQCGAVPSLPATFDEAGEECRDE